eukprot:1133519-Pelagomonas_calceolata.AAC.2
MGLQRYNMRRDQHHRATTNQANTEVTAAASSTLRPSLCITSKRDGKPGASQRWASLHMGHSASVFIKSRPGISLFSLFQSVPHATDVPENCRRALVSHLQQLCLACSHRVSLAADKPYPQQLHTTCSHCISPAGGPLAGAVKGKLCGTRACASLPAAPQPRAQPLQQTCSACKGNARDARYAHSSTVWQRKLLHNQYGSTHNSIWL